MNRLLLILLFMILGFWQVQAQGNFQNLGFESAQLIFEGPPYTPGRAIATTNALPYWSAYSGTNQLTVIPYGPSGAYLPVMLYSQTDGGAISGTFSVLLGYGSGSQFTNSFGSISQTGLVPADAQSLLFEGVLNEPITVSLGGQDLSYTAISNALNYTLYGAAIPASLAGQIETLNLSIAADYGVGLLDNIQFSTVPVPEPSGISLLCLGSGILFYIRKRKRVRL